MPKFAANLSLLYTELPFLDRFAAAARDGFKGVECLFPYEYRAEVLRDTLATHGLQLVLINAPPGDWAAGDRGMACIPGRELEFSRSITLGLDYAQVLGCPRIHVLAGIVPHPLSIEVARACYVANIRRAAEQAAKVGVDILIEPINTRDMPGYFLNYQAKAHALVQAIGAANVKVQFDLYHAQIMEGDLAHKLRQYLPTGRVGHIQIAGVPQRHEPDVGELNYAYLFDVIDEVSASTGWNGWVGCEYRPKLGAVVGGTSAGLGWMKN